VVSSSSSSLVASQSLWCTAMLVNGTTLSAAVTRSTQWNIAKVPVRRRPYHGSRTCEQHMGKGRARKTTNMAGEFWVPTAAFFTTTHPVPSSNLSFYLQEADGLRRWSRTTTTWNCQRNDPSRFNLTRNLTPPDSGFFRFYWPEYVFPGFFGMRPLLNRRRVAPPSFGALLTGGLRASGFSWFALKKYSATSMCVCICTLKYRKKGVRR